MNIGISEIVLIAIVVIALVKPDKISEYTKLFAKTIKEIRRAKEDINEEVIKPITEPVEELKDEIEGKKE